MNVKLPNQIAVRCTSLKEAEQLMRALADETSVVWCSGATPSADRTYWKNYEPAIVYTIEHGHMSYGSGVHAASHGIPIVEFAEFMFILDAHDLNEDDEAVDLSSLL